MANLRFDGSNGVNYLYDISFHLLNEDRKTVPTSEVEFEPQNSSCFEDYQRICAEILKKPGYLIEFRKYSSNLDFYMNMTRVLSKMTHSNSIQYLHMEYFKKVLSNCTELMRAVPAEADSSNKQPDTKIDKASCQMCKKFLCYNPKIGQLEYPSYINSRHSIHLKCEEERILKQQSTV